MTPRSRWWSDAVRTFDEARRSLFWGPLLIVLVALLLAVGIRRVPDEVAAALTPLGTSTDLATTILEVTAVASITVAGLTFSITVIAVQLASSQFSPRVLRGFLRDLVSQAAIGTVGATFVFAAVMLVWEAPSADQAALTANVAALLVLATLVMLLVYIDHMARSMQVGQILRRVTDETIRVVREVMVSDAGTARRPDDEPTVRVTSDADGWVHRIDVDRLLAALPDGATALVEVEVGKYAVRDGTLLSVWDADDVDHDVARRAFETGDQRRMRQDPSFGVRQLADVALRALSPAVNDPGTAYEMVNNLTSVLHVALARDGAPRRIEGADGRLILRPEAVDGPQLLAEALRELRLAAGGHPSVAIAILHMLGRVREAASDDPRRELLADHARAVVEEVERAGLRDADVARVRATASPLLD